MLESKKEVYYLGWVLSMNNGRYPKHSFKKALFSIGGLNFYGGTNLNTVPMCPNCGKLASEEQIQEVKDIYEAEPNEPAFIDCSECGKEYECDFGG